MKPTSNYRMSGMTKTSLATGKFKDAHQKGAWKRAMIDAELSSQVKPARDKGNRKNND
jgi:hypothetical protein